MGALIILGGFVSVVYFKPFPINLIVGLVAIILGADMARALHCDRCGTRVDRQATECPRCSLSFALLIIALLAAP